MDTILQQIADWLKKMLVGGIMNNFTGIFDSVMNRLAESLHR